ncbi:hypothetical protein LCL89_12885 [Halobacillus yeomjeoni]|uniref:GT-D fold domain-containing glycosyltransferase n=1 Tax=Halobacillus yeomjeoni TaxID=311194 RepID=UPI001CD1D6DA|nr:GT-D fold domain-containing glycosyltransferase [Halobacillus yeomjeoni]MCA0984940.1 hypothetical protein [Halobacillus yeomjeoni]
MLNESQLIQRIEIALKKNQPLSIVRIGDGENIVLAQDSVWPMRKVLKEPWAQLAMRGKKGIPMLDLTLRDHLVKAIREADIVGVLPIDDKKIFAPSYLKRPLTDQILKHYQITPQLMCDATVMRDCASNSKFWNLFKGKRVVVIYKYAQDFSYKLQKDYSISVVEKVTFTHYNQLTETLALMEQKKNDFDVALISCGVNSVILASEIAKKTGKVAIDFGKPAQFMTGKPY